MMVVNSHQDRLWAVQFLARNHKPYILLAGSGICTGERVVNYLKALLHDAQNNVLFVCYQAEGTPVLAVLVYGTAFNHHHADETQSGVAILAKPEPWVKLDSHRYTIRTQVH